MNKDNTFSNENPGDYPLDDIPEVNSAEPSESDIKIFKRLYLPESKANYSPSIESIERANNLEILPSSKVKN